MKRGWIYGFLLLTAALMVSAISQDKIILNQKESTIIAGKNITFLGVVEMSANFWVDGEMGEVPKGEMRKISGVEIYVMGLSSTPPIVIMNVTVGFTCGDGNCEISTGEGPTFCCRDCGCLSPSNACISNMCVQNISAPQAVYQCQEDSDCPVSNTSLCTKSHCDKSYVPYRCAAEKIDICQEGDACCPMSCTEETDKDCATVDMCNAVSDCDDNNPCTQEQCEGTPKRCVGSQPTGCNINNQCMAVGEWKLSQYCAASGGLEYLKDAGTVCEEDYECLNENCQFKKCAATGTGSVYYYIFISSVILAAMLVMMYIYVFIRREQEKKTKK